MNLRSKVLSGSEQALKEDLPRGGPSRFNPKPSGAQPSAILCVCVCHVYDRTVSLEAVKNNTDSGDRRPPGAGAAGGGGRGGPADVATSGIFLSRFGPAYFTAINSQSCFIAHLRVYTCILLDA